MTPAPQLANTENSKPKKRKIDLINKLSEDPYFDQVVERMAQEKARNYLNLWWKIIGGTLGVIVTLLTLIGYKEYADIKEKRDAVQTKIEDVNRAANSANSTADALVKAKKDIDSNVSDSQALLSHAQKEVEQSRADNEATIARMFSTYDRTQAMFEEQNRATLRDNQKTTEDGRRTIEAANKTITDFQAAAVDLFKTLQTQQDKFEKLHKEALKDLQEIKDQGDQAKRLTGLEVSLKRAKSFNFVMLQSDETRSIEVADPLSPQTLVRIKFSTRQIKDRFDLRIDVENSTEHQDEQNLIQGDVRSIKALEDKGFAFEVTAVRHRVLAHDFVMLKVFINDAVTNPAPSKTVAIQPR